MWIPRLVVAGTGSGVGKTTTVLALAVALQRKGLKVAIFKCGPDYLDPTYHEKVTGKTCPNLDSWMMGQEAVRTTFTEGTRGADIALIEGVMGLFDGVSVDSNAGSTAEIAQWLEAPVLLTLDASGMSRTFAAIVKGLREFDSCIAVRAAIANFVGSEGHLNLLKTAVYPFPVLGGFPKAPQQAFPERHLGLHPAAESADLQEKIRFWGDLCEKGFDLEGILNAAKQDTDASPGVSTIPQTSFPVREMRCRIAVARDSAFHFYYEENLRLLRAAGAELVYFSPVRDVEVPSSEGLYIGGGYPELHAQALAQNDSMKNSIRAYHESGRPIYAECGGLMYLTDEIVLLDGSSFPTVGLIPGVIRMRDRLQALGYVEVAIEEDSILGPAGTRFRGHQFRYSEPDLDLTEGLSRCYRVRKRRGKEVFQEGYRRKNLLASYVHGHWASNPAIAENFVESCFKNASS